MKRGNDSINALKEIETIALAHSGNDRSDEGARTYNGMRSSL